MRGGQTTSEVTAVKNLFWGLALLLLAGPALAQWELDNARSSIDFISVKNAAIAAPTAAT